VSCSVFASYYLTSSRITSNRLPSYHIISRFSLFSLTLSTPQLLFAAYGRTAARQPRAATAWRTYEEAERLFIFLATQQSTQQNAHRFLTSEDVSLAATTADATSSIPDELSALEALGNPQCEGPGKDFLSPHKIWPALDIATTNLLLNVLLSASAPYLPAVSPPSASEGVVRDASVAVSRGDEVGEKTCIENGKEMPEKIDSPSASASNAVAVAVAVATPRLMIERSDRLLSLSRSLLGVRGLPDDYSFVTMLRVLKTSELDRPLLIAR
jgi:hypothetical protein